MFYHLLYPLHQYWGGFNVFRYITFRTACASLTALFICLLLGPWLINKLKQFQIGQRIRDDGPSSHHAKAGTPTMGGVLVLIAIVLPTLLWVDLRNLYVWVAVSATLLFGAIGFADDYLKIIRRRSLGLTARQKLAAQLVVALLISAAIVALAERGLYSTKLNVPFFKRLTPEMNAVLINGWPIFVPLIPFILLVIVGSSNAVNLTDGLDGLASGCVVVAASAFTALTYITSHAVFANYLLLIGNPYAGELTIFCGAMVGATLGFLWYNAHPAEIFMGDVGSLALGGAVGTVAVLIKQELLLPLVGGVFVIEALSVILQVGSFKLTGKRLFRMAPLHHHFELIGWSESKVVIRFWIAALVFALFSLSTLKLR